MQRAQAFQIVRELPAVLGLPARERVALEIKSVAQVIDARQHRPEGAPVGDHAADRDAAEADPVIGASRPISRKRSPSPARGDRRERFQSGINRFGA